MNTNNEFSPSPELIMRAEALYIAPFRYERGYIFDANNKMVADNSESIKNDSLIEIRGWGRICALPNAEALQDTVGHVVAQALTEFWMARAKDKIDFSGTRLKDLGEVGHTSITYEIRQHVESVSKGLSVVVFATSVERLAKSSLLSLTKEHPNEYFELVEVIHTERCMAFTGNTEVAKHG